MRKSIAGLVFAIAAASTTPAQAITGNYVKDSEHPFVGLAVFYDAAGQFIWRCSGSLISATKFITAGHCADTAGGAASARVYFQQDAGVHYDPATQHDPVSGYPDNCAAGTYGTLCMTAKRIYNFDFANFAGFSVKDIHSTALSDPNAPKVGLDIVSVATTAPGQTPVLHFKVTWNGAPYDLVASPFVSKRVFCCAK